MCSIVSEHCIPVMSMVLLPYAGEKSLSAAAFPDPLQARSKSGSLFAWPFMVAFQDVSSASTSGQRCVLRADSRTFRDKDTESGGVLGHPSVLPSTACIQLIDIQLSHVQMFLRLSPPFPPKGLGMSTSPARHEFHRSILECFPLCQRGASLLECV